MPSEYQMSDYHSYEMIGKGKHSSVYKARRKKSIRYFAMKSVEKGQRHRVMHEVQTMRLVSHENVLKIIACYETPNHLWLILEYCVGGDLLTLLSQDLKLPEPSIMKFARDMFVAVRAIHSKGLIHCDLKPSNMLMDEEGKLKIRGFGLSRKVSSVEATSGTPSQLSRRGTPCYMAPEMFTQEGVHSYETDLWALGCVLYECATGRPPFTSTSLTSLIEQILEHEPAPLPPSFSTSFKNLVFGLLNKRPHARLTWDQVIRHEFWAERGGEYMDDIQDLATLRLPPQPAFEALAAKLKSEDLAARLRMLGHARDSTAVDARDTFMPVLTPSLRDSVNVLKLSRIARSNLQREEVGSYGAGANASSSERDPVLSSNVHEDVELENPDAELNFTAPSGMEEDDDCGSEEAMPIVPKSPPRRGAGDGFGDENRVDNFADTAETFEDGSTSTLQSEEVTAIVLTPPAANAMLVDSRSPVSANLSVSRSVQTADEDFEDASSSMRMPIPAETPAAIGRAEGKRHAIKTDAVTKSLEYDRFRELCAHSSDFIVRPIVSNHRIEVVKDAPHDPSKLPFRELSVNEMLATSQTELEAFLARIYRAVAHPGNVQDKVNTLAYFETLCTDASSANVLANSGLMSMFVKVLASSKSPPFRARLCGIIGLLMRHATHISDEFAKSDAAKILAEAVGDESYRVRRRAMAALGELSFYVAHQQRSDAPQVWGITQGVIDVIINTLENEEDEITKHYACKSVDNILSQGSSWIQEAFASCRVTAILISISTSDVAGNEIRGTAASALARAVSARPESIYVLVRDDVEGAAARAALIKLIRDREKKVQQPVLNLLCRALVDEKSRVLATFLEVGDLLPSLAGFLDRSQSAVIKAKSLLALALLIRAHPKWLRELCNSNVLPIIDRQPSPIDMDPYLQDCCEAFIVTVVALVPRVNQGILHYVERSLSTGSSGDISIRPHAFELFPVLIHLLESSMMRPRVLNSAFVIDIMKYIRAAESEDEYPGQEELRVGVVALLETCAVYTDDIITKVDAVTQHLLPALCELLEGSTLVEMRFLALKLIYDLLLPLRADLDIASQNGCDERVVAHRLDQLLMHDVFPMCPALLDSEAPIPLYALKLLSGTVQVEPALCREIINLDLAPRFFDFLALEHPNNIEQNIRLCLSLARSRAMSTKSLWEYGAPEKVARVCVYSHEKNVAQFIEPALGIAATLLRRAQSVEQGAAALEHVAPLLNIAPTLRQLASSIPDGGLARDITHALDAFNAH